MTGDEEMEIYRLCWEAAAAMSTEDDAVVDACLAALLAMRPRAVAVHLAATGWAAVVADYVVGDGPGGHFSSGIDGPDDATEIFAAVVCAVGNNDIAGAVNLMANSSPADAYEAALQLLATAGAAIAQNPGAAPRRP